MMDSATTSSPPRPNRCMCMVLLATTVAVTPLALAAETVTDTFKVTADVSPTCAVSANELDFGEYNPYSESPLDGTSTLLVQCTEGTVFAVGLNSGQGSGASVSNRKMTEENGNETLNYNLYTDAARSAIWGETTGVNTVTGTSEASFTIYGRISSGQELPTGFYNDLVTVEVTY